MNQHWNVHLALEQLQGIQSSGVLLLQELDKHLEQRDSGGGKHPEAIGTAVAAAVLISYGVEIAIKTLLAQTKLAKPPRCHDLLSLFDKLDDDVQAQSGTC